VGSANVYHGCHYDHHGDHNNYSGDHYDHYDPYHHHCCGLLRKRRRLSRRRYPSSPVPGGLGSLPAGPGLGRDGNGNQRVKFALPEVA
ncbi:MAG TPA: hypothetical protein VK425_10645, partial [Acidimicrobiales bacterium]|nr:hypothetical protein [Acidimicrobiales bacterium]